MSTDDTKKEDKKKFTKTETYYRKPQDPQDTLLKIEKHLKAIVELKKAETQHLQALVNLQALNITIKRKKDDHFGKNKIVKDDDLEEQIAFGDYLKSITKGAYKDYR